MSVRRWHVDAAGIPCTIDAPGEQGVWVVTMASITVSRGMNLAGAIVRAGGGLVSVAEAETLAGLVEARFGVGGDARGRRWQIAAP